MNKDKEKIEMIGRDDRPFSKDDAKKMFERLQEYANGKKYIDNKATENQQWWMLRHWHTETANGHQNEGKREDPNRNVGSAWLVNSLINKHADMMDSYPKPNILPREADDKEEAEMLSSIVPAVLARTKYKKVYRKLAWDFDIDGACITGTFWDPTKNHGLGDITINNIDVHNLFWQPGVDDIQDSEAVFHVTLQDAKALKSAYPEFADKIEPSQSGVITKYLHDDDIDETKCCEVINCYYKKTIEDAMKMQTINEESGEPEYVDVPITKTVLHMAIMVGDIILWSSENEESYKNGYYEHGMYPFVIRTQFPIKDSVWAFGYLDIMKNPQIDIDKLDQSIIRIAEIKARNRYWHKKNAGIDINKFADMSNDFIEVANGDIREQVGLVETGDVPVTAQQHLERKIDEIKETSGNRDFSQGSTASGVTAASAIAALQEAGSKLSRDTNKALYDGFEQECLLVIELIRQFYDEPRTFRIINKRGETEFVEYSNENIKESYYPGGEVRHKKAIFDVEITAEKQSPFNRAAQNETAKELYNLGLFNPQVADQAEICLSMMDFEGKDEIVEKIRNNNLMVRQLQTAMEFISRLATMDEGIFVQASQLGLLINPEQDAGQMQTLPTGKQMKGTPEERAAGTETDNSQATKARIRAANATTPK